MPKKSITVEVNPDILKWAIGSSGWNEQEISKKLKLSSNIFDSWFFLIDSLISMAILLPVETS